MSNKIAVVTGASNGIGKAVALDLAKNNFTVILIARSEEKLKLVQEQIEKEGGKAKYYIVDVSEAKQVKHCIEDVVQQFKHIDFLFNNAGILKMGTSEISIEDIDIVIKINLLGLIYVAQAVANVMKKQRSGCIVNISSMAGKRGLPSHGVYCASKFGVVGYSESLFKELLPYGVKVTSICPSTVATDMTKDFNMDSQLMIQPDDIIKTVRYILSLGPTATMQEIWVQCPTFEMPNKIL